MDSIPVSSWAEISLANSSSGLQLRTLYDLYFQSCVPLPSLSRESVSCLPLWTSCFIYNKCLIQASLLFLSLVINVLKPLILFFMPSTESKSAKCLENILHMLVTQITAYWNTQFSGYMKYVNKVDSPWKYFFFFSTLVCLFGCLVRWFMDMKSYYIAQAGLKFKIFLPLPNKCFDGYLSIMYSFIHSANIY